MLNEITDSAPLFSNTPPNVHVYLTDYDSGNLAQITVTFGPV